MLLETKSPPLTLSKTNGYYLRQDQNLTDLDNIISARTALGLGSAALVNSANFATAAQGALADTAVQPGDLGSAAFADSSTFATSVQGALADTALQAAAIGVTVQGYDASFLTDAPSNGSQYARQNAAWAVVTGGGGSTLPVVDETALVYKTGNVAITQTHDINAYTAARVVTWPNAALTVAGLQVAQTFTQTNTFVAPSTTLQAGIFKDVAGYTGKILEIRRSDDVALAWFGRDSADFGQLTFYHSSGNVMLRNIGNSIVIQTTAAATFRLLPSGNDIWFQNTLATGAIYFSGINSGYVTGKAIFQTNGIIGQYYDATTTGVVNSLSLQRGSSSTPAAGFGATLRFGLKSSTTDNQDAARLVSLWADVTHASRKARSVWSVYDTAEREGIRIEASGTASMIRFYGGTAVAQQTITGSHGGNAALIDLLTKLALTGLIVDGSSA